MPKKKSGIVSAYAHVWPREVFDARVEESNKRPIAKELDFLDKGGVYVLYRDEEPFYVGKADRLRTRLALHANNPRDRYYRFWNFFSAFGVKNAQHRRELEGILIAAMPAANSSNPKLPKERLPKTVCGLLKRLRLSRVHFNIAKH